MAGRPRQFDEDQVLDAAMQVFWASGFEATSMQDLLDATGLHKGSLYQAFGDKHSLFILALKRYLAKMQRDKNEAIREADTPLDGVYKVAHAMIEIADANAICPRGCMVINSLIELAPNDPEVHALLAQHAESMGSALAEAITAAQKIGQIHNDKDPAQIASLITTFMMGLGAKMKGALSKPDAHALLDAQFAAILVTN